MTAQELLHEALGRTDASWTREAQAIWRSSGKSLPDSCDGPFAVLAAQGARVAAADLAFPDAPAPDGAALAVPVDVADEASVDAAVARVQAARAKIQARHTLERGLLIVHTGNGKGKSSSAFGMAIRSLGWGMKVGIVDDARRAALCFQAAGWATWEPLPDMGVATDPTLYMPDEVARPLLDALIKHYFGGEDTRQLRKDYDAERARVDLFIAHLTQAGAA